MIYSAAEDPRRHGSGLGMAEGVAPDYFHHGGKIPAACCAR
jgi:hypothetical protein